MVTPEKNHYDNNPFDILAIANEGEGNRDDNTNIITSMVNND